MYRSLLYSAGGGIVSPEQQAEQACCANIFIGLGGTGIDCLKQVKKQVYEQIRPDNPNAVIPSYRHIKFLAVDADPCSLGDTNLPSSLDQNTEFLDLRYANIDTLLNNASMLLKNPALGWLKAAITEPSGIGIKFSYNDGCTVRQSGRLLLFLKIPQFLNKLTTLITQARAGLPAGTETNIHIFTGLSGGIGSGTFLDVCYLVQYILSNLGIQGSTSTCGYFFMPDVNIVKVADSNVQEYIKGNGFAAMQELDYCMDFENNGGSWDQIYGGGVVVHTTNPPVNLAYLISATDTAGATRADAYHYAMHTVADFVMEFLIRPNVTTFPPAPPLADAVALGHMVTKMHGACYNYCTLGSASTYVPYKEITTYLISKIFEGFGRLNHQLPTNPEFDVFMQTCGLGYEDILKFMNDQVPAVPMYDVDKNLLYQQTAGTTPDIIPQVLGQMRDATIRIRGQMTANQKALLEAVQDTAVENGKGISSMIGRVRKQLILLAANPDKGPYYAAAVLHSVHAKDLSNRVDGFIVENQNNLNMAMADMTLRENSMANALRELQNSNMLNRGGRAERYVQTVNAYYRHKVKIDLYETTANTLTQFKRQISELYTQFFGIFEKVLKELQSTFAENLSTLSHPAIRNNDYAIKLLTIQELQPSLDEAVETMNSNELISGFVTYMLEHPDWWQAEDESKISRGVSNYFLDQLKDFTHRTMSDYLEIILGTFHPLTLTKYVRNEILVPLAQKAEPLFWNNDALYNIAEAGKLGYCSIPKESQEIECAALNYQAVDATVSIRPSFRSDRISFLIFRCGIPMFAYKGTDEYRYAKTTVAAHLYEGTARDPRDWRKLFDITPYSCRNDHFITTELHHRADIVETATQMGIREMQQCSCSCQFIIHLYDEDAIRNLADNIQKILDVEDVDMARQLLSEMEVHPLEPIDQFVMETSGDQNWTDIINRDLIIASEKIFNLLSRQVETVNVYKECSKRLHDFISNATQESEDICQFAYALCTGAIRMKNDYTFTYTTVQSLDIIKETELTHIDTQPYGELLPLYSAFVNFARLNQKNKQLIHDCAQNNWINHPEKTVASLKAITSIITPDKILGMSSRIFRSFFSERQKIMRFLQEFICEVNCIHTMK